MRTKWTAEDDLALERVVASGLPAIAAVNKIDQIHPRDKLLPYMADLAKRHTFADIVPISALKSERCRSIEEDDCRGICRWPPRCMRTIN